MFSYDMGTINWFLSEGGNQKNEYMTSQEINESRKVLSGKTLVDVLYSIEPMA